MSKSKDFAIKLTEIIMQGQEDNEKKPAGLRCKQVIQVVWMLMFAFCDRFVCDEVML